MGNSVYKEQNVKTVAEGIIQHLLEKNESGGLANISPHSDTHDSDENAISVYKGTYKLKNKSDKETLNKSIEITKTYLCEKAEIKDDEIEIDYDSSNQNITITITDKDVLDAISVITPSNKLFAELHNIGMQTGIHSL